MNRSHKSNTIKITFYLSECGGKDSFNCNSICESIFGYI